MQAPILAQNLGAAVSLPACRQTENVKTKTHSIRPNLSPLSCEIQWDAVSSSGRRSGTYSSYLNIFRITLGLVF
jgi:hypothetical protein